MSLQGANLSESAFLASLDARDRSIWRFLATLAAGLAAGLVVGLLAGGLLLLVIALATAPPGAALAALPARIAGLISGGGMTGALTLTALAVATNAPLAAVFIAVAAAIGRRSPRLYVTAAPAVRWRLLLVGLVLSLLVIGPVVAAGQLLDPHASRLPMLSLAPDVGGRLTYGVISIALLIPAAAAEEVVFRGWMLRQTAALTRNPVVLMIVNGVLFSAVHGEFAPDAFLTRTLMGAGFVYMTLRLGGIEFSTGAHAANNILVVLFIQPISATPAASGGISADSLFQDLFLLVSYVAMAELTARWRPLARWSGTARAAPEAATGFSGPWA